MALQAPGLRFPNADGHPSEAHEHAAPTDHRSASTYSIDYWPGRGSVVNYGGPQHRLGQYSLQAGADCSHNSEQWSAGPMVRVVVPEPRLSAQLNVPVSVRILRRSEHTGFGIRPEVRPEFDFGIIFLGVGTTATIPIQRFFQ